MSSSLLSDLPALMQGLRLFVEASLRVWRVGRSFVGARHRKEDRRAVEEGLEKKKEEDKGG